MSTKQSRQSKDYVTAPSLRALRRNMLKKNLELGGKVFFDTPMHYTNLKGKLEFYAWFERDFTDEELSELLIPKRN